MIPVEQRKARIDTFVRRLRTKAPVFAISALAREGLDPLLHAVYEHVAASQRAFTDPVDPRFEHHA
jgi:GTP-binding protein